MTRRNIYLGEQDREVGLKARTRDKWTGLRSKTDFRPGLGLVSRLRTRSGTGSRSQDLVNFLSREPYLGRR